MAQLLNSPSIVLLMSLLVCLIHPTLPYKIIMLCPSIKSQIIIYGQLAKALVSHGNDVTMVKGVSLSLPADLQDPRITMETYENTVSAIDDDPEVQNAIVQQHFNASLLNSYRFLKTFIGRSNDDAWALYNDKKLMKRLAKVQFDFAVVSPPVFQPYTYVAYHLDIPFAYMGIECIQTWMSLPSLSPNYVPSLLLSDYSGRMTIRQKLFNTMMYMSMAIAQTLTPSRSSVHKAVPNRPPVSFSELQRSAALCLRVRESVVDFPRPNLPNVIDIGSMVLREVKPLPLDIQQFLDSSLEGAILVSFGSVLEELPDDIISKMADAFMKTKYCVIWKRKKQPKIALLGDKFLVLPWTPQVDILAHPNTKGFVSHCGFSSMIESVHQGVPVVCMPFAADQDSNANFLKMKGYGQVIPPSTMTPDNLAAAITAVTTGPEVDNIRKAATIFQDLPNGADKAVFWIEHVIKHGSGHLRSSMLDMPLWEYLMLDVISVMVLGAALAMFCVCWCGRLIWRGCCAGCYCCDCCCDRWRKRQGKANKQD